MKNYEPQNEQEFLKNINYGIKKSFSDCILSLVVAFVSIFIAYKVGVNLFIWIGVVFALVGIYFLYIYNALHRVLNDYYEFLEKMEKIKRAIESMSNKD